MRLQAPEDPAAAAHRRPPDEIVLTFGDDPAILLEVLGTPLADIVASGTPLVVIDLAAVARLTRLGIGVLLAVRRAIVGYGGKVSLRGVRPDVRDLFRLTGLDLLFT